MGQPSRLPKLRQGRSGQDEGASGRAGGFMEKDPPLPPPLPVLHGAASTPGHRQKCTKDKGWKGRHQITQLLGLRRIVAVGQRRQGLKAAPPPCARLGLHTPLLFIFTQNVFGFFHIPQRALSIFFLQPLPVLEKLKTKPQCHTHTPAPT